MVFLRTRGDKQNKHKKKFVDKVTHCTCMDNKNNSTFFPMRTGWAGCDASNKSVEDVFVRKVASILAALLAKSIESAEAYAQGSGRDVITLTDMVQMVRQWQVAKLRFQFQMWNIPSGWTVAGQFRERVAHLVEDVKDDDNDETDS